MPAVLLGNQKAFYRAALRDYTDKYGNGIRQCGEMMCAVPKTEIVVSDETPGEYLGTMSETSDEIINMDVRQL